HGKIERDDYPIEKVFFEGRPGFYVTGNLYRPKHGDGKRPGVLCPHGHWRNGRFYDAGENAAKEQIAQGAESFPAAARSPLQARMVHLARMGCVVFHYDMIGYADSRQLPHREGFNDVEAALWMQNTMGLQTWSSIRALDFLLSLDDVDPERIGVTGASGGGTQTFMLGAVDDRPDVAFPAVMVSTNMQGGCVCENAPYLRLGINNIALAALFAPRPLAMSGADDWTIDIESKGLPELRQVYALYGRPSLVTAEAYPQFKHNYNQVAREMMSAWFKEHLKLPDDAPVTERDFEPVEPQHLSVFDADHPRPENAVTVESLRADLTETAQKQFSELLPKSKDGLAEYRRIVGGAAAVMLDDGVPREGEDGGLEAEGQIVGTIKLGNTGDVRHHE
ncbi:MAG: alpha/beta hydrolase family protein, partial [Planctomycetaceae bacterium]